MVAMHRAAVVWRQNPLRRGLGSVALVAALLLSSAPPAAADRWYAEQPVLGIAAAGRQVPAARQAGATWDRALFLWQEIQPNGPSDWLLDKYVDEVNVRPS